MEKLDRHWHSHFASLAIFVKWLQLSYEPEILLIDIYPREENNNVHTNTAHHAPKSTATQHTHQNYK